MKKITKKLKKYYSNYPTVPATKKSKKYLEKIRNSGEIYDFKIVCDNTNNYTDLPQFTASDIYIQKTKKISFVVINIIVDTPFYDFWKREELKEERIKKLNKLSDCC